MSKLNTGYYCTVCGNEMSRDEIFFTEELSPFHVEPCTKCKLEINKKLEGNEHFPPPWKIGQKSK